GFQRGFQHVAGNAGVLADDHGGPPGGYGTAGQHAAGGVAQAQGEFCVDPIAAHDAAHPVGSEILACAHARTPCSTADQTRSASTVSATSWTRKICAPRTAPARAAATLPPRRRDGGRPVTAPIMDLRDTPSKLGYSCPTAWGNSLSRV